MWSHSCSCNCFFQGQQQRFCTMKRSCDEAGPQNKNSLILNNRNLHTAYQQLGFHNWFYTFRKVNFNSGHQWTVIISAWFLVYYFHYLYFYQSSQPHRNFLDLIAIGFLFHYFIDACWVVPHMQLGGQMEVKLQLRVIQRRFQKTAVRGETRLQGWS